MSQRICESVADQLPDHLQGRLAEVDCVRVDEHRVSCPDCSTEWELLVAMRNARPAVPAELDERVRRALSRRPQRWVPAHLAIAASVVLALVTAGLLLSPGDRTARSVGGESDVATTTTVRPGDPLLTGGAALGQLSVAELERLLAELDS